MSWLYEPKKSIADYPTRVELSDKTGKALGKALRKRLAASVATFSDCQERLYAHAHHSVLLVFQGMDAAGKDSTIKKVTSGVNPQGFQVFNFKQPTHEDVDHNYLWRYWKRVPERGRIGIFNRSYYEETLVVRVHPELLGTRRIPDTEFDDAFWAHRFSDIRNMEAHLARSGTRILKFFLNVSRDEQKARFFRRMDRPDKQWKLDPRDIRDRRHWDDYLNAYDRVFEQTHTDAAPWHVVPADDKPTMRCIVAEVIVDTLTSLTESYPEKPRLSKKEMQAMRQALENEDL